MMIVVIKRVPAYKHQDKRWDNPRHHAQWEQKRYDQKRVNPSRDWRVGQNLPRGYDCEPL